MLKIRSLLAMRLARSGLVFEEWMGGSPGWLLVSLNQSQVSVRMDTLMKAHSDARLEYEGRSEPGVMVTCLGRRHC